MRPRVATVRESVTWQGVELTIVTLNCGHQSIWHGDPSMAKFVFFGTITNCAKCQERGL